VDEADKAYTIGLEEEEFVEEMFAEEIH